MRSIVGMTEATVVSSLETSNVASLKIYIRNVGECYIFRYIKRNKKTYTECAFKLSSITPIIGRKLEINELRVNVSR